MASYQKNNCNQDLRYHSFVGSHFWRQWSNYHEALYITGCCLMRTKYQRCWGKQRSYIIRLSCKRSKCLTSSMKYQQQNKTYPIYFFLNCTCSVHYKYNTLLEFELAVDPFWLTSEAASDSDAGGIGEIGGEIKSWPFSSFCKEKRLTIDQQRDIYIYIYFCKAQWHSICA